MSDNIEDHERAMADRLAQWQRSEIRRGRIARILAVASASITISVAITVIFAFFSDFISPFMPKAPEPSPAILIPSAKDAFKDKLENLEKAIKLGVPEDASWKAGLGDIKIEFKGLSSRMANLESALLDTPEKALAVPLLRKEIDGLRNELDLAKNEVERIHSLTLWLVGLTAALAFSVIGVAFAFRSPKPIEGSN